MKPFIKIVNSVYSIVDHTIKVDFDEIGKEKVLFDFILENAKESDEWYWEIFGKDGLQLDAKDLTRGLKAELMLLKTYSGPINSPNVLKIQAKSRKTGEIAYLTIKIFCQTKIKEAYWSRSFEEKQIYKVAVNHNFKIYIQAVGVYGMPMELDAYFIPATREKDIQIGSTSHFSFEDFYEKGFFVPDKLFGFFKDIVPALVKDNLSPFLAPTGELQNKSLGKLYFILKSQDEILFNGKSKRKFLEVFFDGSSFIGEEDLSDSIGLSPALLSTEEYFTQKYEPCKYTAIKFLNNENSAIIFDENEPSKSPTKNTELTLLASNDVVNILVENIDTTECQFSDQNKELTSSPSETIKDHTNRVIDVSDLYDNHFLRILEHTDSKLSFSLEYPYIQNDYLAFLYDYFFNVPLKFKVPIKTCRYSKILDITIYPDALWTFHFNHFVEQDYFYKNQPLSLQKGFTQLWAYLTQNNHNLQNAMAAFLGGISVFKWAIGEENYKVLMEDFKEYLESVQLGFHSQFLTQEGKQTLDYSQEYYLVAQYIIFCNFSLRWALEIFFIYLSRGRTLVKLGEKAQRWVDKTSKKVKKIKDTLDKYDLTIYYPAIATNHALYYEKLPNGQIALIVEHNVKADPMIGIGYNKKYTLGELVDKNIGNRIDEILKEEGVSGSISVNFKGTVAHEYNAKINLTTEEISLQTLVGELTHNELQITDVKSIDGFVKSEFDARVIYEKSDISIALKTNLDAKGNMYYSVSYGKDSKGIFFQPQLYFSGVKGTYMISGKVESGNVFSFEHNPEEKPIPFVLFEPEEISFLKIYLFKI